MKTGLYLVVGLLLYEMAADTQALEKLGSFVTRIQLPSLLAARNLFQVVQSGVTGKDLRPSLSNVQLTPSVSVNQIGQNAPVLTGKFIDVSSQPGPTGQVSSVIQMRCRSGQGGSAPQGTCVASYLATEMLAGAANGWAFNPLIQIESTYDAGNSQLLVSEFDMNNNNNYVDPRLGPSAIQNGATVAVGPISGNTNGPTAAGSNVLHFANTPSNIAIGMVITNKTKAGAIPAQTYLTAFTSTTVTMSTGVSGIGIGNGDTIAFQALYVYGLHLAGAGAYPGTAGVIIQGQGPERIPLYHRGLGCFNSVDQSCVFDYSNSAIAVDIWGSHTIGIDMTNAAISGIAIKAPGFTLSGTGVVTNTGMPTTCAGYPPGTLWNNSGVVNVCP